MQTPTITIIGSLNTDLIMRTPRLPHPGETLTATSFSTGCGGKGCNQAVACARLSRSSSSSSSPASSVDAPSLITTRMLGAVGDDEFGGTLIDGLQRNGVDASNVSVVKGQKTGVAVIVVEEDTGENRILLTPGANFSVTPGSVPETLFLEGKKEEEKKKPALVILQLEIPLETVVHVCKKARADGVPVLLNPAPAPAEGKKGLPVDVFMGLEHLILNETEAGMLSGLDLPPPPPSPSSPSSSSSSYDKARLADICHHFHRLGVMNVILTLGARGVYWSSSGGGGSGGSKLDSGFIPATTVPKVVDTTAAGDTFVGAYAVAVVLLSGEEEEEEEGGGSVRRAVEWANRAAGKCVMKEGAMEAIPWRGEVGL